MFVQVLFYLDNPIVERITARYSNGFYNFQNANPILPPVGQNKEAELWLYVQKYISALNLVYKRRKLSTDKKKTNIHFYPILLYGKDKEIIRAWQNNVKSMDTQDTFIAMGEYLNSDPDLDPDMVIILSGMDSHYAKSGHR